MRAGDGDLLNRLYLRYFDGVYAYASAVLGDASRSEEVAQETFQRVHAALTGDPPNAPFRTLLFATAQQVAAEDFGDDESGVARKPRRDPADRAVEPNDPELLLLIGGLPLGERQVLALRYLMEMAAAEVAAVLDRPEHVVRQLEHRGTRTLEARLAGQTLVA